MDQEKIHKKCFILRNHASFSSFNLADEIFWLPILTMLDLRHRVFTAKLARLLNKSKYFMVLNKHHRMTV